MDKQKVVNLQVLRVLKTLVHEIEEGKVGVVSATVTGGGGTDQSTIRIPTKYMHSGYLEVEFSTLSEEAHKDGLRTGSKFETLEPHEIQDRTIKDMGWDALDM